MVREKRHAVVYLIETKVQQKWMEQIKRKLAMKNGLMINPIGLKGGLAILWDEEVDLEIINLSSFHIHTKINNTGNPQFWHLTGFYDNPETSKDMNHGSFSPKSINMLRHRGE